MSTIFGKRKMDDSNFVQAIVDEARQELIKITRDRWPQENKVPSLSIPYSKYEWERIRKNWILFENYAYKRNFTVIKEEHRYIRYTYVYYDPI